MTAFESYVQRVRQVDAVELDTHVLEVLKLQVSKITKVFGASAVVRYQPEVDLLISFLVWKFSVWEKRATYGQQLLSVRYGDCMSWKKALSWAVLTMAPTYVKDRYLVIQRVFNHNGSSEWVSSMLEWGELGLQLASVANSLVFLMWGRYPTLVDRVLSQGVESVRHEQPAGYQFLTRELLWHTLLDVFTFILPLVNYHYLRRMWRSLSGKHRYGQPAAKVLSFTPTTKCPICDDSPVNPHHMGCAHVFCYYCLKANCLADAKFECPLCGCVAEDGSSIEQVCQDVH